MQLCAEHHMKRNSSIITLFALSIVLFSCRKNAAPEIIASPGKTRAPIEIHVGDVEHHRGRVRLEIIVTPAEPMAFGKFTLRLQANEKRPHTEPVQYLRNIAAGNSINLSYDLPRNALQSGNPVLDAETEIAGLTYRSSHEIVINPTAEKKEADRENHHERKVKELR